MIIRKAKEKDIPRILELLEQVLQIHADIRPDIFIPGTTKYTIDEGRGDFLYKRAKVPKFGRDPLVFTALKFYTVSNRQRTALNKQKHRERLLKVPGGKENRGRFTVIYR